ncbi:DUF3095 domain-containing protein [Mesorhizobium sp. BAC0120]|uniref:DUF3095 domain-containing protein n=1 Tax=Mesorhizobium sp. BAC0120 TaxID=3090670 RepID=UPI00298CFC3D|nr:DUF3095 domain-containing protein [Mesorhizobium sp. BAC0120]MDW6025610.1 DUF3095 domain-containing protein [Mesorhizobium sp. BAC0120]
MNALPAEVDRATSDAFFDTAPAFAEFEKVADADNYRPLPDDWMLAAADIVNSSEAIAAGRYKVVNMAGAGVISAILNALGRRDLPFAFGGDGALVAVPSSGIEATRQALAAVKTWVAEELGLDLRAALVPVTDIRADGLDVRVARFQAGPEVTYAMFTGGGASWAEREMKAGRYAVAAAPPGSRPDLEGLSCRWNPIETRNGEIVSIIVVPQGWETFAEFQKVISDILAIAGEGGQGGHPLPAQGPAIPLVAKGVGYEVRAVAAGGRLRRRVRIYLETALAHVLGRLGLRAGRFDPAFYRADVATNSDFRKFDDGLKMTIDIDTERLSRIEKRLEEAVAAGHCRYGLHRQKSALMTCIVPSPFTRDHMHFIDGAAGGYAVAARNLKAALSS